MTPDRCSHWRRAFATFAGSACLLVPAMAWARTMEIAPYPIASVWPAAVRFLRVDRDFPVREKDEPSGYVLFDYTDGPRLCKASLELIRTTDREGREATRIAISIPDLPRRYEQMLLDKFVVKLRDDQGPPAPPPRNPPPPPPDAAAANSPQTSPAP
jgi:hypothetical protein